MNTKWIIRALMKADVQVIPNHMSMLASFTSLRPLPVITGLEWGLLIFDYFLMQPYTFCINKQEHLKYHVGLVQLKYQIVISI